MPSGIACEVERPAMDGRAGRAAPEMVACRGATDEVETLNLFALAKDEAGCFRHAMKRMSSPAERTRTMRGLGEVSPL
jgi:hypothetical protein